MDRFLNVFGPGFQVFQSAGPAGTYGFTLPYEIMDLDETFFDGLFDGHVTSRN
jgi:hypothetical protein